MESTIVSIYVILLMNAVKHQVAVNPHSKPTDWDCKSTWLLLSSPTIAICCYYSVVTIIIFTQKL